MDGSWSSFVWFWICWGNFERIKRVLHGNLLSPGKKSKSSAKSTIYVLTQKTTKSGSNRYEIVLIEAFLFSQSKSRSFIVQPIVSLETDLTKTRNGEWGMRLGLRFNWWIVNIDVHQCTSKTSFPIPCFSNIQFVLNDNSLRLCCSIRLSWNIYLEEVDSCDPIT